MTQGWEKSIRMSNNPKDLFGFSKELVNWYALVTWVLMIEKTQIWRQLTWLSPILCHFLDMWSTENDWFFQSFKLWLCKTETIEYSPLKKKKKEYP